MAARSEGGGAQIPGRLIDRWRASLAAHDPALLDVAPDARYTENGQELAVGDGIWRWATAVADRDYFVVEDADLGQTCWSGVVDDCCVFARLGHRDGRVHEIETVVRRPTDRLYAPQNMLETRVFDELEPDERATRDELVGIANAYFDGLDQVDGDLFAAEPQSIRRENGQQTVLVEDVSEFEGTTAALIFPMPMQEQISSGYFTYIDVVRNRRVAAVDESRGLVILMVVFDHSATLKTVQVKGIGEVEVAGYHQKPNSVLIAELFQVRAGRIAHVEAILEFTPFGTRTGWEEAR